MASSQSNEPSSRTTIVYSYKARLPLDDGRERAAVQISAAHAYYNQLIEIERDFRQERAELRRRFLPVLDAAEFLIERCQERLAALQAAVKERNARERRKRATKEEQQGVKIERERLRDLYDLRSLGLLDADTSQEYQDALAVLQGQRGSARREAYAAADCGWGTRLKIGEAAEKAIKDCKGDELPRFRRWTGDGLLAVQVQKGMEVSRLLLGGDNRVQFERMDAKRVLCRIRIGSRGRSPVWLSIPINYHRDLPADGKVMWVVARRTMGAPYRQSDGSWRPYEFWDVQFSVRLPGQKPIARPLARTGKAGVDLGWRVMPDGSLRVAYAVGSDGQHEDVRIPARELERWHKADSLREIRDREFNEARAALALWMEGLIETPDWLSQGAAGLHQWRNHGRLAWLIDHWQSIPGDAEILDRLREWRKQDAHLLAYEQGVRRQAIRWRLHHYRTVAAGLARRYHDLHVEDCDWRKLMKLPEAEENESVNQTARYYQRVAAVGLLRQCLAQCGAVAKFCRTADTTRACHVCGIVEDWDREKELRHTCVNGHEWDQDANAAHNLLASGDVVESASSDGIDPTPVPASDMQTLPDGDSSRGPEDGNGTAVAPVANGHEGRWQKRKRLALARRQEKTGASKG